MPIKSGGKDQGSKDRLQAKRSLDTDTNESHGLEAPMRRAERVNLGGRTQFARDESK